MRMLRVHDVSISVAKILVSSCSFDDDPTVIWVRSFEEGDGVGVPVTAMSLFFRARHQEMDHSSSNLNCLAHNSVAGVGSREGIIDSSSVGGHEGCSKLRYFVRLVDSSTQHS